MTRTRGALQRGFVLLAILWVMISLATFGLGVTLVARHALAGARNRREAIIARWRAADCIERARAAIDETLADDAQKVLVQTTGWYSVDSVMHNEPLITQGACDVQVRSVGTAVNINSAGPEALRRLFAALGVQPKSADSLADAILDWRDPDNLTRADGAERDWYVLHGRSPPRNGAFADIRELARVRGFANHAKFNRFVDVEDGRIDVNHAPLPVLAALPGFNGETLARIAELRGRGLRIGDLPSLFAMLSDTTRLGLAAQYSALVGLTTTEPDAWIVTSRARSGNPTVTLVVEVRIVRSGASAVVVRRRTWFE